ncbi:MAG: efflux RND transporter periplasmic adaptor subunit [Elusimicrobia bacterium]|nr:efflux RND transporter periplasmic adaptor subunit [Candidatus Obscuribacterium magneticum]
MHPLILKHKKVVVVGGIALVCLLLGAFRLVMTYGRSGRYGSRGAVEKPSGETLSRPAVQAFVCKKTTFVDNLVLTGTLQGGARVELRFNREGRISKINYRIGGKVLRGAVIAELDTGEANIRLQQAESELSQAVELYRAGAIAKPRLTQAQLAANLAREEFGRSFIKAPREGSIGELNAEVGEYVNTQMTVASLVSIGTVFVEVGVIEKDLGKIRNGQGVDVEVETYPGVVFKGKVAHIAPLVEGTSRTRTVRAEIPNEKGVLLPGMFARVKVFIMEKPDVLVVPWTALREGKAGKEVFRLDGDNVHAQSVQIGYESSDYVEILSGLKEGDKIVAQVTDRLQDGGHVEVIEETAYGEKN